MFYIFNYYQNSYFKRIIMRHLIIIIFSITLILGGCGSTGNESIKNASEAQVKKQIIEGVTSKDQVQAMFGSPIKTSYTDNV